MAEMGQRAIAESKALGVPAYYMDPTLGAGIIKELPDGTRQRVERTEGNEIVLETFGPSAGNPGLAGWPCRRMEARPR